MDAMLGNVLGGMPNMLCAGSYDGVKGGNPGIGSDGRRGGGAVVVIMELPYDDDAVLRPRWVSAGLEYEGADEAAEYWSSATPSLAISRSGPRPLSSKGSSEFPFRSAALPLLRRTLRPFSMHCSLVRHGSSKQRFVMITHFSFHNVPFLAHSLTQHRPHLFSDVEVCLR